MVLTCTRRPLLAPLIAPLLVVMASCEPTVTAGDDLLPDPFELEEGRFAATVSGEVELELAGTAAFEPYPITEEVDQVVLRAEEWEPSWEAPSLSFTPTAVILGGPVFPFEEGTHRLGLLRPVHASLSLYVGDQLHTYLSDDGTLRIHASGNDNVAAGFSLTASRIGQGGAILGTVKVHGAFRTLPPEQLR